MIKTADFIFGLEEGDHCGLCIPAFCWCIVTAIRPMNDYRIAEMRVINGGWNFMLDLREPLIGRCPEFVSPCKITEIVWRVGLRVPCSQAYENHAYESGIAWLQKLSLSL